MKSLKETPMSEWTPGMWRVYTKGKVRLEQHVAYSLYSFAKNRVLNIMLIDGGQNRWTAIAGEGPENPTSVDQVFSDHSHALVCKARAFRTAVKFSEAYAKKWKVRKEKGAKTKKCGCKSIEKKGRKS